MENLGFRREPSAFKPELQTETTLFSESSNVSMKSDQSMSEHITFSTGGREPSNVSMKGDQSMSEHITFSTGGREPSNVPMKSDQSMSEHITFSTGGREPSNVLMKSDQSMSEHITFSTGGREPSNVTMKSDQSMSEHITFSTGGREPRNVTMKSDQSMSEHITFSTGGREPSNVLMKSDQSMSKHITFSTGGREPSNVPMTSDQSMQEHSEYSTGSVFSDVKQRSTQVALQQNSNQLVDDILQTILKRHKTSIRNKYENLFEGIKSQENKTLLNRIYTQLYIMEGESEGVNEEHEVLQMEKTHRKHVQDIPINCLDIFKCLQDPNTETKVGNIRNVKAHGVRYKEIKKENGLKVQKLRTVLTKGIAGIGKTVSVQKFILDWAEGKANQDVEFIFVLPFRELNLIKDDQYSFHQLLCVFHPELKDLEPKIYDVCKAVFIFDGLDESRIPLKFEECEKVSDVTMTSSVSVLMTNLIKGDLLPSALIWITSRPAAANQIPPQSINRVTEIQGFTDPQKEEYFRKRISDQDQAQNIISHIKTARSLHIMCHIPVFCWISATVLQRTIKHHHAEIPKTLTEMYSHFLITQTSMKKEKYEEKEERDPQKLLESNRTELLKLAKLAFKQLMKGNVMFYEEDLRESGINVTEASVNSGIFTEIFREECVLNQRKVYCFVHLSFQEFLAAVYVFHCYEKAQTIELECFKPRQGAWFVYVPLDELLMGAVDKALKSQNGHLDLFVRFLLGISVKSNQRLLLGLLTYKQTSSKKTTEYIKKRIKGEKQDHISTERSINLFLCLSEMKDQSLSREIQEYLKSEKRSVEKLSPGQCSALACMLLISEEVLDELDLKKYNTSEDGYRRLIPAITVCRKARLANCNLGGKSCEALSLALLSVNSSLKELDLSNNDLQDSGVQLLSAGLRSSDCKLEKLRLSGCMVTEKGCLSLASALKSNSSHLRELDLTYNNPGQYGEKRLTDLLEDPHCKLEKLKIEYGGAIRMKPGLEKYACRLTLDPNTAHSRLSLSERNRKVTFMDKDQSYPDHPDRFESWPQVLSVESLTGRCYWEAEWSGFGADIAMLYRGISRKGACEDCVFGNNNHSWRLEYYNNRFSVRHNNQNTVLPAPPSLSLSPSFSHSNLKVGVYLDSVAGSLTFYNISPDTQTLTHLHTFYSTFTEPLHAGFRVWIRGSSVHV